MRQSPHAVRNTLLCAPTLDGDAETQIYEILTQTGPEETNLLVISYRDGPDKWFADWQSYGGQQPADLGFIHVGEITRSAATTSKSTTTTSLGFLDAVGNPADLTGLCIQISKYLERWAETDRNIVVYFNSLTSLLQFVDLNKAYRFLHVLIGRVKSVDGHAYYRIDSDAHESQTVAILQSLMDDVIDFSSK
ncbi:MULTISPECIES: DUF7504 family protein [Halorussus]|uniref:DUF7504 family protein n=1 Tax=Halorussus TaxID=1070314 RepID=UPI0020A1214A|nr:hypothetical protein [Halorussus vallis]USZ75008.1 hypothetical protein NGM07_16410 [Halorussus vallis]